MAAETGGLDRTTQHKREASGDADQRIRGEHC
jgi:hypothetical protein